jgi:tetratricopeptide (TPR) repeat protein
MRYRSHFTVAILAVSGCLLTGCSTGSRSGVAAKPTKVGVLAKVKAGSEPERLSGADLEKKVQAYAHYASGFSFDLNEKPELALEEYLQSAAADPSYEPIVIEVAKRLIRSQKPEKAVELLTKTTALPTASGAVFAWLGLAYGQAGQKDLAIEANRAAIKKMPRSLPAYQNLAQIYLQNRQTNEALQVLDEAGRQPSVDAPYLVDLAELYSRFGRILPTLNKEMVNERVKQAFDRAAKLKPAHPIILQRLGDGYVLLGDLSKAEGIYLQLVEKYPDLPIIRGKLAEIYLREKKKDKAMEQLEAIAKEDPTNPRTHSFLGAMALEDNKFEEAAQHFERALLLSPELEPIYYDLAGVKLNLEKPDEALALLEKARKKFKLSFVMEFYTAIAHVLKKEYPQALKYFTSAEVLAKANEPGRLNPVFYYQLGSTYERNGDHELAEKAFQKCLELAPANAEAMNYLGYMWAELGIKLEEARALIDKAVKLEPKNAAFLDSMGWVLFKLNQPKEALPYLLEAIENSKKPDATLLDHLGDIYSSLKEHEQAREAWRKSLSVEPNEKIKQKLDASPSLERSTP